MDRIIKKLGQINLQRPLRREVSLAGLTTFRLGGPAEFFAEPVNAEEAVAILKITKEENLPVFVLGKGANLLVSDKGIRGLVLSTAGLQKLDFTADHVTCGAGLDVSQVVEACRDRGYSALEFLYAMPSSVGGAIWMNARCYGSEISEHIEEVVYLDEDFHLQTQVFDPTQWDYKISPFQKGRNLILEGKFRIQKAPRVEITNTMTSNHLDRENKGHFKAPCAGSIFKNNRDFREPSGVLIDKCGLKGLHHGGAQVAPWHGNIIIAREKATAQDVRTLIDMVKAEVKDQLGFTLEEEVIYAGEW